MSRIFSPNLEYALGWTVVHSLWQATAIALMIAILMIALRKHSAQTRYVVGCVGLFTTLLTSIITFCFYFEFRSTSQTAHYLARTRMIHSIVTDTRQLLNSSTRVSFQDYFNQHLPLIVSVWLMGVALFALRLLSGISYIAYLKRYRNSPMLGDWQARVEYLSEQLGVKKAVEILESALVKTPMTIGALKPIILFPIGAVTYLSVEQMEAILAHELAHIRRNDYFFNILQSLVEIIFYFHPAVWWLSNTIRNERENCCDDIAVSVSGNSLSYAKALVNLQELHAHSPMLAMGFAGTGSNLNPFKNQLINRVKRLLNIPQNKSNILEKIIATCFLLVVFAFTTIHETRAKNVEAAKIIQNNKIEAEQKTQKRTNNYKDGLGTFSYIDDNENVKWQMRDGEIVQLNINGKEISEAEFPNYYASLKRWKTSIPELISDSLPNHSLSNNLSALTFRDGKNKYDYIIENGEITHLNVNGKVIPKEEFGKYTEFLEKRDAIYPPPPPPPPVPPVPPVPPIGHNSISMNSWNSKNSVNSSIDMTQNAQEIAQNSLRIANQSLKNMHFDFDGKNYTDNCNPCEEQRLELKNELKDLVNKIQEFDTDDSKDVAFYNKKAAQIKDIKRRLNNSGIQNDEINKIRNEMHTIRQDFEDFDDTEDLYPNKKTKYGWQSGFEAELLKDGLITDAQHYSVRMQSENDEIEINNEQKSRTIFLKYQALYERLTGSKLRRAGRIEYNKE